MNLNDFYLQLFEIIAKEVPLSFSELNESRLCELIVYILNRVTVGNDSLKFDQVIKGCKLLFSAYISSLTLSSDGC